MDFEEYHKKKYQQMGNIIKLYILIILQKTIDLGYNFIEQNSIIKNNKYE